jgi:hypothetical protein
MLYRPAALFGAKHRVSGKVQFGVFALRQCLQVLWAVVVFDVIPVVDNLSGQEIPAQYLLHNKAMVEDVSVFVGERVGRDEAANVPLGVCPLAARPVDMAAQILQGLTLGPADLCVGLRSKEGGLPATTPAKGNELLARGGIMGAHRGVSFREAMPLVVGSNAEAST